MNYLAYSWVDQNMNIDEAFKMLTKAVELAPRDGMIIDCLGWAYYRLGRYEDAVRELEKAVELKPGDPAINDHLGRRLLEGRPQARGEVPVGPRQGLEPGARGAGEDPQEDRQRPRRGAKPTAAEERACASAGGAEAERRLTLLKAGLIQRHARARPGHGCFHALHTAVSGAYRSGFVLGE